MPGESDETHTGVVRASLVAARAAESLGWLVPADWPDVAVALLLQDAPDPEFAELAGLGRAPVIWVTKPLVDALYERHGVAEPTHDEAVGVMAGLAAADLRRSPSPVTGPMIRLLARLAQLEHKSDLADRAYGAEEYLDCDCRAGVDPNWEAELEALPGLDLPDDIVRTIVAPWRSTLPTRQPPCSHA